ncbi:MAG: hypothetical protein KDA68_11080 [Planctomycetaceae bacterium]|nr:hypothetical protein [Planctomycetaceae bacterium]
MSSPQSNQPKQQNAEASPKKKSYFGRAILVLILIIVVIPLALRGMAGSSPHKGIQAKIETIGGRAGIAPSVPGFLQEMFSKEFDWEQFYGCVTVSTIALEASGVTDEDLAVLKQTPHLKSLGLNGTKIGDAGAANLANTPELATLTLTKTAVTDATCDVLKDLKELKELQLGQTDISDAGAMKLGDLTNIETLVLSGTKITDETLKVLAKMPKLKTLSLDGCQLSDEGVAALKDSRSLQNLSLERTPVTGSFSSQFAGVDLRSLSLSDSKCDGISLGDASFKETLEILNVDNCPITDEGIPALASFSGVQTLMMNKAKVTDKGIVGLKDMPNLVLLTIMETDITVEPLHEFKSAPKLQRIRAWNSKITNDDMGKFNGKYQFDINLTEPMN